MAASLIGVPEITIDQELTDVEMAGRPDYLVNGHPSGYFQYIDWEGRERICGNQKGPVRIKYRNPDDVQNRLQLVVNPVTREFTLLTTNVDGTVLYGYDIVDNVSIGSISNTMQTLAFVDLSFELPPVETLFSCSSIKCCLQILLVLVCILIALGAVAAIMFAIVREADPTTSGLAGRSDVYNS